MTRTQLDSFVEKRYKSMSQKSKKSSSGFLNFCQLYIYIYICIHVYTCVYMCIYIYIEVKKSFVYACTHILCKI